VLEILPRRLEYTVELCLIYEEAIIREATDNPKTGISVSGRIINTIRYADDNWGTGIRGLMKGMATPPW